MLSRSQAIKKIDELIQNLDNGEEWKTIRGPSINFLGDLQRSYFQLDRAREDAEWKLEQLKFLIATLHKDANE
jgi:hypothetical protein